jgi:photosystem II stability/assembly factor-like uncharacterized protein
VYATADHLYRSSDGGQSFALVPASVDEARIGRPGTVSLDARSIYLNTIHGPVRSDDRGAIFISSKKGFRAADVQDQAFDANGKLLVAVIHTVNLYRETTPGNYEVIGANIPPPDDTFLSAIGASPTDANVIVAAKNSGSLYRTADGGRTWTLSSTPGAFNFAANMRIAFPTASRVYLVQSRGGPGLYRSDDGGRSFKRMQDGPNKRFAAIAVDPRDPDHLFLGSRDQNAGLWESTDGGATIVNLVPSGDFAALAIDSRNAQAIYAAEVAGHVQRSLDGGKTWTLGSGGLKGDDALALGVDGRSRVFVWMRQGGLFRSDDQAASWVRVGDGEVLRRSGAEAQNRGALVIRDGEVFLANEGVIQVSVEQARADDD